MKPKVGTCDQCGKAWEDLRYLRGLDMWLCGWCVARRRAMNRLVRSNINKERYKHYDDY